VRWAMDGGRPGDSTDGVGAVAGASDRRSIASAIFDGAIRRVERQILARLALGGVRLHRVGFAGSVRGVGSGTWRQETGFGRRWNHAPVARRRPGVVLRVRG